MFSCEEGLFSFGENWQRKKLSICKKQGIYIIFFGKTAEEMHKIIDKICLILHSESGELTCMRNKFMLEWGKEKQYEFINL